MRAGARPLALVAAMLAAWPLAASPLPGTPPAAAAPLPRVVFAARPGASVLVDAAYPAAASPCVHAVRRTLHARFSGTVEVGKDRDGSLFVVGELPLEDYLEGLAEVPPSWPIQALEAQAVAARSYAMAGLGRPDPQGARLGYDLCATAACQVYRGLGVADGPYGARWRRAVELTRGQVLLYRGRPADALYFSTSNGRTHGNDEVFGTAPLPYLRPVREADDAASPLSRWRSRIRLSDAGRFLARSGLWPSGRPLTGVRRAGASVVLSGPKTSRTVSAAGLRTSMNAWAGCLEPGRYPPVDAGARLPQTVPSIWFRASTAGGDAVLDGRGWGHGVGMVQWGAYGKARRGRSYADILAGYYGGLRPRPHAGPPTIRVGIAVGLSSATVVPSGPVGVSWRSAGAGPWRVTGGRYLHVRHAAAPRPAISVGSLTVPALARAGTTAPATLSLPQLSVAALVLRGPGGERAVSSRRTYPGGSAHLRWRVPALPNGRYRLQAVVTDGVDVVRTRAVTVRVAGGPPAGRAPSTRATAATLAAPARAQASPSPTPGEGAGRTPLLPLLGMGLAALLLASFSMRLVLRRLRDEPPPPPPKGGPWWQQPPPPGRPEG